MAFKEASVRLYLEIGVFGEDTIYFIWSTVLQMEHEELL